MVLDMFLPEIYFDLSRAEIMVPKESPESPLFSLLRRTPVLDLLFPRQLTTSEVHGAQYMVRRYKIFCVMLTRPV